MMKQLLEQIRGARKLYSLFHDQVEEAATSLTRSVFGSVRSNIGVSAVANLGDGNRTQEETIVTVHNGQNDMIPNHSDHVEPEIPNTNQAFPNSMQENVTADQQVGKAPGNQNEGMYPNTNTNGKYKSSPNLAVLKQEELSHPTPQGIPFQFTNSMGEMSYSRTFPGRFHPPAQSDGDQVAFDLRTLAAEQRGQIAQEEVSFISNNLKNNIIYSQSTPKLVEKGYQNF